MPRVDMPIEELENYMGSSCCPDDFLKYWETQKRIVEDLFEKEDWKEEISFQMKEKVFKNCYAKYYEISFQSIDGASIYVKYVRPNSDQAVPVVLQFHDYEKASRSWFQLTRFPGIGYAVLAMDCRGQGGNSQDIHTTNGPTCAGYVMKGIQDSVDDMYYRFVYIDALIVSKIAEKLNNIDKEQMITFGEGQGGALAIVTSALNANIKKCAVLNPFLSDFKRVLEMNLDENFYAGMRYYFKWRDPLHKTEDEIFRKLGFIDIQNFASMIKAEFLMGTGLLDRCCPPSTQYAVYNKVNTKKHHSVFPKFEHEPIFIFEQIYLKFFVF